MRQCFVPAIITAFGIAGLPAIAQEKTETPVDAPLVMPDAKTEAVIEAAPAKPAEIIAVVPKVEIAPKAEIVPTVAPVPVKAVPVKAVPVTEVSVVAGEGRGMSIAEAIAASSITSGGKAYPRFAALGTRSTGNASCNIGDTQAFANVAAIELEGGKKAKKSLTWGPMTATYSPPNADWVIQSYNRVVVTSGGTLTASDSAVPANFQMNSSSAYSSVVTNTQNYIASLNIPNWIKVELSASAATMVSNISSYGYSLSSSNSAVTQTAQVWGTGIANTTQGHSWYHGHFNGTLVCAPSYLRDAGQLEQRMKTWVNGVVSSLPVTVSGVQGTPK